MKTILILCVLITLALANVQVTHTVQQNLEPNCTVARTSKLVTFILAVIPATGTLGVDRFYSGWTTVAYVKLLVGIFCNICTCGLFSFIFWLCDFITLLQESSAPPYTYMTDGYGCPWKKDF